MTCGRALDVLDAKDPAGLVASWLLGEPLSRGLGLPARICTWREGGETCERPVRAVNARFCEAHAAASARRSKRAWKQGRGRKSEGPPALANGGPAGRRDSHPGISVLRSAVDWRCRDGVGAKPGTPAPTKSSAAGAGQDVFRKLPRTGSPSRIHSSAGETIERGASLGRSVMFPKRRSATDKGH